MKKFSLKGASAILFATSAIGLSQQIADPTFDTKVANAAFTVTHPAILFDAAHHNFHTPTGRYKPFADVLRNDGFLITENHDPIQPQKLKGFQILAIVNALGADQQNAPEAGSCPFSDTEIDAIYEWVKAGGSLLLIADHAPFGSASEKLATKFGVDMSKGHTIDDKNFDTESGINNPSFLVFADSNHLLGDSVITRGRSSKETLHKVITFTGQSLRGPTGSIPFLKLSDSAVDQLPSTNTTAATMDKLPNGQPLPPGVKIRARTETGPPVSAAGRSQGLAFELGKGRVVVMGEAAALSAQIVEGAVAQLAGQQQIKIGMNRTGIDNEQLGLNIMHWLARLI